MPFADAIDSMYYNLHGTWLEIGWDAEAVGEQLQVLSAYFGLDACPIVPLECQVQLTFLTQAPPLSIPPHASCVAQQHGLQVWQAGSQLYVHDGAYIVRLDPASPTGFGTLSSPDGHATPPLPMDLLLHSMLLLLRYQGFYPVHAACVAYDGVSCLLVGNSGSGKSTLTLGLVQEGWHYLTDDATLLRGGWDTVVAMPLRRDLCLTPEAIHAFPDTLGHWQPGPWSGDLKQRLDMRTLYPAQVRSTAVPRLLLFPTIVSAPHSQLVPMRKAEALFRLIQQSGLVTIEPPMAPGHLDVLARLIRQTRHYRLLAGQDLALDPRRIALLLESVRQQPAPCEQKEEIGGTTEHTTGTWGGDPVWCQTHFRAD
jgi:hypothetical protein